MSFTSHYYLTMKTTRIHKFKKIDVAKIRAGSILRFTVHGGLNVNGTSDRQEVKGKVVMPAAGDSVRGWVCKVGKKHMPAIADLTNIINVIRY